MKRALVPILALALALPALALAGHPKPGAHYVGTSVRGDQITLGVNKHGHHMYAQVKDPCGNNLHGTGLTVGGKGRFDAVSTNPRAELSGHFVGRKKAVGTFRNSCKDYGERHFIARRK